MSGDNDYGYDVYGDTDPDNVPDGGFGQNTTAGDGLPGFPVEGHPGWRAGAFNASKNLLGLIKVSNPAGADAPMPKAYMPDGHGGVQLRPEFAATHPKGPLDFGGMGKEINWPGAAWDLSKIAGGVGASVGLGVAGPFVRSLLGFGAPTEAAVGAAVGGAAPNPWIAGAKFGWQGERTLHKQNKANPKNATPVVKPDVDEASSA